METQMKLQGLIISLRELNIAKEEDNERFVMEDGLTELLDGLYRYGVQIVNLDMFGADNEEKLLTVLNLHSLTPECCLLLAATDRVLSIIEGMDMAACGYLNPRIPGQKLSAAKVLVESFEEVDFHFLERVYQREHGLPWTAIETRRCFLREITLADLDNLYELYEGKSITQYMEGLYEERAKEEEYTRAYIENMYYFYGYGMWLAIDKITGKLIGRAGLNCLELHGEPALEMGYVIGEEFQNQGYATELCREIIHFAQKETEFDNLHCLIHKDNGISIHLAENLGFSWQEELKVQGKMLQRYTKSLERNRTKSIDIVLDN